MKKKNIEVLLIILFLNIIFTVIYYICEEESSSMIVENISLKDARFYENETEFFTTNDSRFLVVRGEVENLTMVEGDNNTYFLSLKMENPVTTKNGKENLPRIVSVLDSGDLYRFQIPISKDIPAEFIFDQRNNMTLKSSRVILDSNPKNATTISREISPYPNGSFYKII